MDEKTKKFIQDLEIFDSPKATNVKTLYKLFSSKSNTISEKFIYGGIGFFINNYLISGIYVSQNHVSLVFSKGYELEDKFGVLEGKGKYRRYIKIGNKSDIEIKQCSYYIEQIITIELKSA